MRYRVVLRTSGDGKFAVAVRDGNGTKWAGLRGLRSLSAAANCGRRLAEELVASDKLLGKRSWIVPSN